MTPKQRVEAALRGERANKMPLTAYAEYVPQSASERRLRNGGLCVVHRQPSFYQTAVPHTTCERIHFEREEGEFVETRIHTPEGELSAKEQVDPATNTSWYVERLYQQPEDYRKLQSLFGKQQFLPRYGEFARAQEMAGEDVFFLPEIGYSPLHYILYELMGIEAFSIEWAERRDEVLSLYEVLVENRRRLYEIAANSPALLVNYDADISSEIVGLQRFEEYYMPHYEEFAEIMHRKDKLTGIHLDGDIWLYENAISASSIDCIESFTPPPDGDLDLAQARVAWHDKILWINIPPTLHQYDSAELVEDVRGLLRACGDGERVLLGFADAAPDECWQENFNAVLDLINGEGNLPLNMWAQQELAS
jgi:hypothetical protein